MELEIFTLLEPVLTAVGVALAAIIAAGIRHLFAKMKNERLRDYGDLLAGFAETAVKSVAQAEADVLKEAATDGKLTDEEKQRLKQTAVDTIKSIAPDVIIKFMSRVNSDVDALLDALIESAVKDSKEGSA